MTFEQAVGVLAQPRQNNGKQEQEALLVVRGSVFKKPEPEYRDEAKVAVTVTVYLDDVEEKVKAKYAEKYNTTPENVSVVFKDVKVVPNEINTSSRQGNVADTGRNDAIVNDKPVELVKTVINYEKTGHRFVNNTVNWKDGSSAMDKQGFLYKFLRQHNISVLEAATLCDVSTTSITRMCSRYKVNNSTFDKVVHGLNFNASEAGELRNSLTKRQKRIVVGGVR